MKFKVGDKVVPHSKSRNGVLISSRAWKNAQKINQPFLYIVNIRDDFYCCDEGDGSGDHFNESDLTLYTNTLKPESFHIKSDNPHLLKAIWEELKTLGYITDTAEYDLNQPIDKWDNKNIIINNSLIINSYKDKKTFTTLVPIKSNPVNENIFNLPKDWDQCLEFAKKQIDHPFWNKKQIKKIILGSKLLEFEITKGSKIINTSEGIIDIQTLKTLYKQIPQDYTPILGYEVLIGITMIKIGCMTFSYTDLTKLIYEYDQLQNS